LKAEKVDAEVLEALYNTRYKAGLYSTSAEDVMKNHPMQIPKINESS